MSVPSASDQPFELLDVLAEEFASRLRRGERPTLQEYQSKYPELAEELAALLPAMVEMERADVGEAAAPLEQRSRPAIAFQQLGDYRVVREIGRGGMGVVYEAVQQSLGRSVALKILPQQVSRNSRTLARFRQEARAAAKLHHTNIVPVFEVGQSGETCFFAMQLIQGQGLDQIIDELRRLKQGAAAGASAQVPAVGAITQGVLSGQFQVGQPNQATPSPESSNPRGPATEEFVVGTPTEAQSVNRAETAVGVSTSSFSVTGKDANRHYFHSVARIGQQTGQALAYAHSHNIIHRDIKPSNLMLDASGVVWVMDFGLAKMEDDGLTGTGEIVGTLRYIAPERLRGECDARADIYALGLTLYEMVTLRPAFDTTDKIELLEKIHLYDPPAPRHIDPAIPRDLETIILKAIQKTPSLRYASAEEMAEDLRRFLNDEPIAARQVSTVERIARMCRRNPLVSSLTVAVALSLLLGTVVAWIFAVEARKSATQAGKDRDKAIAAEREGKRKLFEAHLSEANAIRMSRQMGQRFGTLKRIRDALEIGREIGLTDTDKLRLRNVAIAAFCLPDVEKGLTWSADEPMPQGVDPIFQVREKAWRFLKALGPQVNHIKGDTWYSLDGRYVAVATEKYIARFSVPIRIYRIDGPKPEIVLDDADGVHEIAINFHADGKLVAIGHQDGTASVYQLETGKRICRLPVGSVAAYSLAFHPKLPRLAVSNGSEVTLWDVGSQRRLNRIQAPGRVTIVAWHPRGHRLAIGSETMSSHQINLYDAEQGTTITPPWLGHKNGGIYLAFNRAGDRVVSNDWSNILRLWDAVSGRLLLSVPSQSVYFEARFGAGDQSFDIASGSGQRWVQHIAGGQELRVLQRPTPSEIEPLFDLALHPDGRLLAARTRSDIGFFDLLTSEEIGNFAGDFNGWVKFDAAGTFWNAGRAGLLRWPVESSKLAKRIGPPEWVGNVSSNPNDKFSLSSNSDALMIPMYSDGSLLIRRNPRSTIRLGPQYDVRHGCVSPDGHWVLTFSHWTDATGLASKLWDARTGKLAATLPSDVRGENCDFSRDSRWIHVTGKDSRRLEVASIVASPPPISTPPDIRPWEAKWKSEPRQLGGALSPDGRVRAYGYEAGEIRLVTADENVEIARLPSPQADPVTPSIFSPDGSLLIAWSGETRAYYIYDLRRIREQLAELGLDWSGMQPLPVVNAVSPHATPLSIQLIDADRARTRATMSKYESDGATIQLLANPFDAFAHFRLGQGFLESGRPTSAFAHLSFALALRPDLDEAIPIRALAGFQTQRWEDVEADTTRYLTKYPFDSKARHLRAQMYRNRKLHAQAVGDYSELLKAYPSNLVYFESRAQCYVGMGKSDLAAADRVVAIRLGAGPMTRNLQAWYLATAPEKHRDPDKAFKLIQEALKAQPKNLNFLTTLGAVQYRQNDFKQAIATLSQARAAGAFPKDGRDLLFVAMAHAKLGDHQRAKKTLDEALLEFMARKDLPDPVRVEFDSLRNEAEATVREIKKRSGGPS